MQKFSRHGLLILSAFVLAACSSGGDDAAPATIVPTNNAPTFTDPGTLSVLEGSTTVATIEAKDLESGSAGVTQTISGGADASSFAITSGGELTFASAPDFETPGDSDGDNVYEVTIQGEDQAGATATLTLSVTVTDAIEGRIIDGPLSGAQVFIDLDDDGTLDEGEPSVTSDENGYFKAPPGVAAEGVTKKIVSIGGTDTATGKELPNIALISVLPSDPTKPVSVTPLTTVISSASTPEEQAKVLTALGISGTVDDLLTTDTWAAAEAGDATAQELQRKNQQVGLILQTADSLVSDDAASSATALTEAVAAQIVEIATTNDTVDLTSTATVTEVLSDSVAAVDSTSTVDATAIAAVADSVADVNTLVSNPDLDPTSATAADIAEAAQSGLQDSVESLAAGTTDTAAFEEATETKELFKDAPSVAAMADNDEDGIGDAIDPDDDNDGVEDTADAFPLIALGSLTDTDKDGRPNDCDATCQATGMTADTDDDNDSVLDTADALPLDKNETVDTDGDGIGNNTDTDDDGDGVADASDAFPLDKTEATDTDKDGIGNNTDTDDDGDGLADTADAFPLVSLGTLTDTDKDGRPNTCDATCQTAGMTADDDDDNDGVADSEDAFPLVSTETLDTDGDGIGNNTDTDDDGDGISDADDLFPLISNVQKTGAAGRAGFTVPEQVKVLETK